MRLTVVRETEVMGRRSKEGKHTSQADDSDHPQTDDFTGTL